jgi:hypothetical protein
VEASNPISNRRASHGRQGCQDGRAWPSWGGRCIKRGNRQSYSAASGRNLPSFSKNAKSATVFGGRPVAKRGQNATFHVRLQAFPVPSNLLERGKAVALLPRAFGAGGAAGVSKVTLYRAEPLTVFATCFVASACAKTPLSRRRRLAGPIAAAR